MNCKSLATLVALFAGLTVLASDAAAQLTYFDADIFGYEVTGKGGGAVAPNTTLVDGTPVITGMIDDGDDDFATNENAADDLWRVRTDPTFGNRADPFTTNNSEPSILESRGAGDEDTPTLKTTVAVPDDDQGNEVGVYVLFWGDTSSWQVGGSLTNSNDGDASPENPLQPVFADGDLPGTVDFGNTLDASGEGYIFSVHDLGDAPDPETYPNPLFMDTAAWTTSTDDTGNRDLLAGFLGNTTLGSELSVFVNEGTRFTPDQAVNGGDIGWNHRTWYDGIAYGNTQPVEPLADLTLTIIPEPSSLALLGLCMAGMFVRRKR